MKLLFFDAVREVPGIKEPDTVYEECCKRSKHLREQGILDKYIINEEEASALCAITYLKKVEFDIETLFYSLEKKDHLKLAILTLRSLRKLQRHKGTLYIGKGFDKQDEMVMKGKHLYFPFCIASPSMDYITSTLAKIKFKEIFRVEHCWGYDISDFAFSEDDTVGYCNDNNFVLFKGYLLFYCAQ